MVSKKATIAVIVLAMVAVFSSGMIYAYFDDTETSSGNSFSAGTLDLKVNSVDNPTSTFTVSNVYPGATNSVSVTLTNSGTISGTLSVAIISVTNGPGQTPEPEAALGTADNGELGSKMDVTLWIDTDGDNMIDGGETTLYNGLLDNANGVAFTANTLAGGVSTHIGIMYSVPDTVGNEIQGDICTFSIQYTLVQA
jgi:spore coat-associated protein N